MRIPPTAHQRPTILILPPTLYAQAKAAGMWMGNLMEAHPLPPPGRGRLPSQGRGRGAQPWWDVDQGA